MEVEISICVLTIFFFIVGWFAISNKKKPTLPEQLSFPRQSRKNNIQAEYKSAKHKFEVSNRTGLFYCNICTKLIGGICQKQTLECKICGILVHQFCRYKRKPDCKYICLNETKQIQKTSIHQWVDGNLPINSICAKCELICMSYYGLEGSSCLWCQKVVHDDCKEDYTKICDQGFLFKHILCAEEIVFLASSDPRSNLQSKQKAVQPASDNPEAGDIISKAIPKHQNSILGHTLLTLKFHLQQKKYPIVVLINRNSGGQSGSAFLNSFYRYLNPIQVISIIDDGLERLKVFSKLKDIKIIVAGGDGTVGSVITYIKSGDIEEWKDNHPPIAVLPLGTGNDLSRALGWGGVYESLDAFDVIQSVATINNVVLLDRWNVKIKQGDPSGTGGGRGSSPQIIKNIFKTESLFKKQEKKIQETVMLNYCGIGIDAKLCLGFHNLRQKNPQLFKSRIGNKFIYTSIGANDFFTGNKTRLGTIVQVFCDGVQVEVPESIENIVVININSWAGGVSNVWKAPNIESSKSFNQLDDQFMNTSQKAKTHFKPQRMSDGILEVIGIYSILHLGRIQVGIDEPIKICQGRDIKIIIDKITTQAMQIDGEPQEIQTPIQLEFNLIDKVQMLSKTTTMTHNWEGKVLEVMTWAQQQSLITPQAKQQILERMLQ